MSVFINERIKPFPFEQMFDKLLSVCNGSKYRKYLYDWQSSLTILNQNFLKELCEFNKKGQEYRNNNQLYEYYVYFQPIFVVNTDYYYHYDIEYIKKKVGLNKGILTFTKKLAANIQYDKEAMANKSELKNKPVILVPSNLPQTNDILIDGNKRLNFKLQHHKPFIRYIFHIPVDKENFVFSIDWGMYWFVKEISLILSCYNDLILENLDYGKSFLYSESFVSAFK